MDFQKLVAFLAIIGFPVIRGNPDDFLYHMSFTDVQKNEWVDAHNYYRRKVQNPEAANMRLMTWDNELEELAKKVVRTCAHVHTDEDDRKTSVFPYVGENLYTGGKFRYSEMANEKGVTKLWFDEVVYFNFENALCVGGECGHYKQLVWAKSFKVGCALASCRKIEKGYPPHLVSCNYGPGGNYFYEGGEALAAYVKGEPCTQCDDGDLCIDQLCNNTERDFPFTTATTVAAKTTTPLTDNAWSTTKQVTEPVSAATRVTESPSSTRKTTTDDVSCLYRPWPCSGHRLAVSSRIFMALALFWMAKM